MKSFICDKIYKYISVGALMSFSCKKGEFNRCFNRLDRPVEGFRPDRQGGNPTGRSTRPVSISNLHFC